MIVILHIVKLRWQLHFSVLCSNIKKNPYYNFVELADIKILLALILSMNANIKTKHHGVLKRKR